MTRETEHAAKATANPGYALFQMARALTTAEGHPDPATRARAEQKIANWVSVFNGILDGTLNVGSRTPLHGIPGWVTLEVLTGGFTTGNKLAGGPLLDHERALLSTFPNVSEQDARRALNTYYLSDRGLATLQDLLQTGCFRIDVPEEGAFPTVAWLVRTGHVEEARKLLETLAPFLSELRFYPAPAEQAQRAASQVFLQSVGDTIEDLHAVEPNHQILKQKETVEIWTPLYDQMIALFLETVDGDPPFLRRDASGNRAEPALHDRFPTEGGWPCRRYPVGWHQRARQLLDEIAEKRSIHRFCGRPERTKSTFAQLHELLQRCTSDPASLTGRDVGRVRLILAGYVDKRGTPDSSTCRVSRQQQLQHATAPMFHEIARVLIGRLSAHRQETGLDDLGPILQPVTAVEERQWRVPADTAVPPSLQAKARRCLNEAIDVLVRLGVITSGEVLARVLPQITSGLRAAAFEDPDLRRLYAAVYRAFRRRRSLLLLNLESQIRIEELPWMAVIDRFRQEDPSVQELARQTLEEMAFLTISSFPHMIIPNKLVQEMRALAKTSALNLPLVEELAADIFMGEFGGGFVKAAKQAADLLEGTLYERYYGIDYRRVRQLPVPDERSQKEQRWGMQRARPDHFAVMCSEMAGVSIGTWSPATNGMIIEQQQILTTQNLAVLVGQLDLQRRLDDGLPELVKRCFAWICRRQQMKTQSWHDKLIMLKNTAYAWRQMVFYLALLPHDQVEGFQAWAGDRLNQQRQEYRERFRPALEGLAQAVHGQEPSCRFLGWSKEQHWLLS